MKKIMFVALLCAYGSANAASRGLTVDCRASGEALVSALQGYMADKTGRNMDTLVAEVAPFMRAQRSPVLTFAYDFEEGVGYGMLLGQRVCEWALARPWMNALAKAVKHAQSDCLSEEVSP